MQMKLGRFERRQPREISMTMSNLKPPVVHETAVSENVSPGGFRLLSNYARNRNDIVEVTLQNTRHQRLARVVYCQKLSDGRFGIGLELLGDPFDWAEEISPGVPD